MSKDYYQPTGRPHSGLSNPAKFGLTFEQVVELIDSGNWNNFYRSWWSRKKREKARDGRRIYTRLKPSVRKERKKKFKCTSCRRFYLMSEPHVIVTEHVHICETCVKMLVNLK